MQSETALRLPALAMQLSNEVKTFVLRATKVPKRTANTMATASARTPHTIPATACPGFAAPLVLPRATEQDEGHGGHQAGHAEDQGGHAQAVAGPG